MCKYAKIKVFAYSISFYGVCFLRLICWFSISALGVLMCPGVFFVILGKGSSSISSDLSSSTDQTSTKAPKNAATSEGRHMVFINHH